MKKFAKTILASLVLLGIAAAPAMAGDHGKAPWRDNGYQGQHHDNGRHDDRGHRSGRGYYAQPSQWRAAPAHINPVYYGPRYGYGPQRVPYYHPLPARPIVYRAPPRRGYWYVGAHYYEPGYAPTVVVNNYGAYGLLPPPPGYVWRRSDVGDFVMVAVATGIIADIILSH
jgi:Ni/Co efflux regulator RcnB